MNDDLGRKMPFSLEAEQAVLGSILIDPACMDRLAGIISRDDFYMTEHAEIYSAMQSMYMTSKNIDVVTLINELVTLGTYDEAGGREYLKLVAEAVPTSANAADYAQIIRDKAILRQLIDAGESITEAAYKLLYEGTPLAEAFATLLQRQRKTETEDAGWL